MGARRFCNIGRILASVGIVFVLLVVFQGSGSAGANSGTYGWELGAQFDGETAGFQGNDSGVDVVCPDGYLVAGGGIDWGWNGLLRTISGIALACRKVNELGANPDWMQSFYDWDAATTTATWGTTPITNNGTGVGSFGATNMVVEGFWVLTRVWQGGSPSKLSPWVNYHRSHFDFSAQSADVQWDYSADGLFAGSVVPSNLAPSNNDTGSCGASLFDVDVSLNDSPYTTLHAVRGLHIYRYTPAFSNQQRIGGFTVMCQDLNRVELSSPTSGPSFQPAAKGLGVSISGGQTAVVPAGETFSYTINVTNDSNETATGVMLVTKLDDSSTFVFASSSRGQCSQSGVEVACPLGSLAGGASASVSITLIAATSGLVAADSITLSAASGELSADQSSVHRTTIVYGSTTPASGGLSVSLSDEVDPVVPGETLTYIVTVSNDGSQAVGGVSIVDSLPLEVELVSVSSSQGSCIVAGGVVVCSLGILEAGASAIVSFGATVSSASSTVTNDVTVSGSTDGGDEWITTDSESTTVAAVGTDRSITGSVRDSAGNPIPGVPIVFFTSTGGLQLVGQVSSDSSGSYIIEELIPGTYFAFASPQQSPNPANFVDSWYDQKQNMQQANLVDVTIGSATEVDFQLRSRLPHRAYFGKVIEVNPNNFSTETKFGIVRAGTGPGTSVAAPGIGLADGGTLAPGQRVAVLTDLPSLVGADVADSELVTAIHVTIIPNKPRRDHLRGVVAEKAPDGKATVVLEAGNTLRVSEAQAKTMTGGAHVVMVVHSVGADKKVEVLGSVHSDAIQDRLDNFLGAAVAAGITGAALSLESLRGAHLAQVDFSTGQSQDNADEDIKDSLDAAISQHAEDERQKDDAKADHAGEGTKGDRAGEGTKDGQGGKDGEGSKDGGGGHEGERVDQVKNWRRLLLVGR